VLADELAALLPGSVRAGLDDFHHPRAYRHAHGRTGRTVWQRSFDLEALRRELLDPWRLGAGASYRRRWHDLATDRLVDELPAHVPEAGVLVVDGVFAQRPEPASAWDLVVWVHADDPVRLARMAVRDGLPDDPDHPDQRRYLDAQVIYRELCHPAERADVVVDNTDPERLRIR
jgi:uridine kinase